MGCSTCSNGSCGVTATGKAEPKGCRNNGSCGTSGCNKMNVFDWLGNMDLPSVQQYDIVEVKFKGGRKGYFRNSEHLFLITGDEVIIDASKGYDLGHVSLQGELVRLQLKKRKIKESDRSIAAILRKASPQDRERAEQAKNRELSTMYRTREIIKELGLEMKLSDVDFQADNTKATFYYSAESRVDFRELIKILANEFRIRVEMRQISLRQEAGRLGGIGSCGRELCCSTWLSDFKSVSTSAARYQNLSLNPSKLSGQCGRLKCCLNYELETYLEALKDIPKVERPLKTERGLASLQKTDIFKKIMWFSYESENNWYPVPVERVKEIIKLNKEGQVPEELKIETKQSEFDPEKVISFEVELNREDKKKKVKRKRKRGKKKSPSLDQGKVTETPKAEENNPTPSPSVERKRKKRRYRRKNTGGNQNKNEGDN